VKWWLDDGIYGQLRFDFTLDSSVMRRGLQPNCTSTSESTRYESLNERGCYKKWVEVTNRYGLLKVLNFLVF